MADRSVLSPLFSMMRLHWLWSFNRLLLIAWLVLPQTRGAAFLWQTFFEGIFARVESAPAVARDKLKEAGERSGLTPSKHRAPVPSEEKASREPLGPADDSEAQRELSAKIESTVAKVVEGARREVAAAGQPARATHLSTTTSAR